MTRPLNHPDLVHVTPDCHIYAGLQHLLYSYSRFLSQEEPGQCLDLNSELELMQVEISQYLLLLFQFFLFINFLGLFQRILHAARHHSHYDFLCRRCAEFISAKHKFWSEGRLHLRYSMGFHLLHSGYSCLGDPPNLQSDSLCQS